MKNPNNLLKTEIVKCGIKRWFELGYESEYILEKLKYIHHIEITEEELNLFIETKLYGNN